MKAASLLLLSALSIQPHAAGDAQQVPQGAQAPTDETTLLMTEGADALVAKKYLMAASSFEKAASRDPQNSLPQYWAGQALVYGDKPEQAIHYLERAQALGSDSVALHFALVAAYAGAQRAQQRDQQRDLLHAWHASGEHLTLAHAQGFLLETIFNRPWHINVMEYFDPEKGQHVLWRFTVRDSAEIIEMTYVLRESPVSGQMAVASGSAEPMKREFVLVRYGGEPAAVMGNSTLTSASAPAGAGPGTANGAASTGAAAADSPMAGPGNLGTVGGQRVKVFESKPSYDAVRNDVLQRLHSFSANGKKW